jgi:putative ABC transport system permease protein
MLYVIRFLVYRPIRFALTVSGIALCMLLMLFLLAIYQGVSDGSVEYIRRSKPDLWVIQRHSTNLLRSTSILTTAHGQKIRSLSGVEIVAPLLFVLSGVRKHETVNTTCVIGYDPLTGLGGPPEMVQGRSVRRDDEIVLDLSFAARYDYTIGDTLEIREHRFCVVGLCTGANIFVVQYSFMTLSAAQSMISLPTLVACYLVNVKHGADVAHVAAAIRKELPGVAVYDHPTFIENNLREMRAGFIPLLYTIAAIGAVVLTIILSLLLTISILEQRKDFALIKTLGAPSGFLPGLIIGNSLALAGCAAVLAMALFFPLVLTVARFAPEISTQITVSQVCMVFGGSAFLSLIGSLFALQKLRRIYPLEAFR